MFIARDNKRRRRVLKLLQNFRKIKWAHAFQARDVGRAGPQVMASTTPPSARTGEPEIAAASRDTRKATTSAISSGCSSRLMIELSRVLSMNSRCAFGLAADWPMERNMSSTPSVRVGHHVDGDAGCCQ